MTAKRTHPDADVHTILNRAGVAHRFPDPAAAGMRNRIALWFGCTGRGRRYPLNCIFYCSIKLLKKITGIILLPHLSLAIKKDDA